MGIFSFGMFKSRRAARPTTAVPTPTPTQLKRDGYVWPSDKPSLEFEDLREQLRAARGRSRFS